MTKNIDTLDARELDLIAGGVTEGPNGQGCTEPRNPGSDKNNDLVSIPTLSQD